MFEWWKDVVVESHAGDHTPVVTIGLRYGFILFVMSEIMFFAAWFWSFFKHAMYPMYEYVGTNMCSPTSTRSTRSTCRLSTRWCCCCRAAP